MAYTDEDNGMDFDSERERFDETPDTRNLTDDDIDNILGDTTPSESDAEDASEEEKDEPVVVTKTTTSDKDKKEKQKQLNRMRRLREERLREEEAYREHDNAYRQADEVDDILGDRRENNASSIKDDHPGSLHPYDNADTSYNADVFYNADTSESVKASENVDTSVNDNASINVHNASSEEHSEEQRSSYNSNTSNPNTSQERDISQQDHSHRDDQHSQEEADSREDQPYRRENTSEENSSYHSDIVDKNNAVLNGDNSYENRNEGGSNTFEDHQNDSPYGAGWSDADKNHQNDVWVGHAADHNQGWMDETKPSSDEKWTDINSNTHNMWTEDKKSNGEAGSASMYFQYVYVNGTPIAVGATKDAETGHSLVEERGKDAVTIDAEAPAFSKVEGTVKEGTSFGADFADKMMDRPRDTSGNAPFGGMPPIDGGGPGDDGKLRNVADKNAAVLNGNEGASFVGVDTGNYSDKTYRVSTIRHVEAAGNALAGAGVELFNYTNGTAELMQGVRSANNVFLSTIGAAACASYTRNESRRIGKIAEKMESNFGGPNGFAYFTTKADREQLQKDFASNAEKLSQARSFLKSDQASDALKGVNLSGSLKDQIANINAALSNNKLSANDKSFLENTKSLLNKNQMMSASLAQDSPRASFRNKQAFDLLNSKKFMNGIEGNTFTDKDKQYINSKDFLNTKKPKRSARVLGKAMEASSNPALKKLAHTSNLEVLKKAAKDTKNFNVIERSLIKARIKAIENKNAAGIAAAIGRIGGGIRAISLALLRTQDDNARAMMIARRYIQIGKAAGMLGILGLSGASRILDKLLISNKLSKFLRKKALHYIVRANRAVKKALRKAMAKVLRKPAETARVVAMVAKETTKMNVNAVKQAGKNARKKLKDKKKAFDKKHPKLTKGKNAAKKAARKTGRAAGAVGRGVARVGGAVGGVLSTIRSGVHTFNSIISAPFRWISNGINFLKKWIAIIIVIIVIAGAIMISIASFILGSGSAAAAAMPVCDDEDMAKMEATIQDMKDQRDKDAIALGKGKPKDPNVRAGHTIDRYGHPANTNGTDTQEASEGYSLHYTDVNGKAIANGTANDKDIIVAATVMFDNDNLDTPAFQDLLRALFQEMNPEPVTKESGIYDDAYETITSDGFPARDTVHYYCNDASAYDTNNQTDGSVAWLQSQGVKFYQTPESYRQNGDESFTFKCNDANAYQKIADLQAKGAHFSEDIPQETENGCTDTISYKTVKIYPGSFVPNTVGTDPAGANVFNGTLLVDPTQYSYADPETGDTITGNADYLPWKVKVDNYSCPGHTIHYCMGHTNSVSYGRKDVEIDLPTKKVTDLYKENWMPTITYDPTTGMPQQSYAPYILDFVTDGGWTEENQDWANTMMETNFYEEFGVYVPGASGSVVDDATLIVMPAQIYHFFKDKGLKDEAIAGILGNMQAESGFNPKNLQNSYEKSLGMSDDQYTKAVDDGTYTNFVDDSAGYGLVQFTSSGLKQGLYDIAKGSSRSVGDYNVQCEAIWQALNGPYASTLEKLKDCTSASNAADIWLEEYEKPANINGTRPDRRKAAEDYLQKIQNGELESSSYIEFAIGIAQDDSHGYAQDNRTGNPDYDCSSLVFYSLQQAGYNVGSVPFSTAGEGDVLMSAGFTQHAFKSVSDLQAGDILWRSGHTEIYIGGGLTAGAHCNEKGGITGGQPGDQTGHEINTQSAGTNWTYYYRAPATK